MTAKRNVSRIALAATLTLLGCGSGPATPVPVPDANTPLVQRDAFYDIAATSPATCPGAPNFSSDDATCNTVVNDAPSVLFTAGVGDPPTFTGGTIRDGVYYAVKAEA